MTNINKFYAMIILFFAFLAMSAVQASAKDINGFYVGDGVGGAYFIRQIGTKVYWVGEDTKGGWANVFEGTISGGKLTGHWWDIPKGRAKGGGDITFDIKDGGNTLTKVTATASFGSENIRVGPGDVMAGGIKVSYELNAIGNLRSRPEGFRTGDGNLTGAWNGDDFATYYVREMPNGDVVWFAENNMWGDPGGEARPSFARVFIGKKIGGLITGNWVDVPKGKASGSGVLGSKLVNQQEIRFNNPPVGIEGSGITRSMPNDLRGYADLHTHPMVNLGLGRKFIHGAVDVGSLIPADHNCKMNYRATSIAEALDQDNSTHGGTGWFGIDNRCGDNIRQAMLDNFQEQNGAAVTPDNAVGYPSFKDYPKFNDITHQKMWVDWVRRSYDGGQRVLVALAMNNQTLASAVSGPGDGPVTDKESADLQIDEMKLFVGRHNDFMEVALSASDVRRIVAANKMAVILGIEIDNIGDLINYKQNPKGSATGEYLNNFSSTSIANEVKRLYDKGVRYVFPVHLIDNGFGGTAIYQDIFNLSNYHIDHKFWEIECSKKEENITKLFKVDGFDFMLAGAKAAKLGIDITRFPPDPPVCSDAKKYDPKIYGNGHVNAKGLDEAFGTELIKDLMQHGMLIDIDHSSIKTINSMFKMAEAVPGGYPLVSGHTGLRSEQHTENSRTPAQLAEIAKLGGMFGLGSDDVKAFDWASQYVIASRLMGLNSEGRVAFGSDLNGLVKGPQPLLTFTSADLANPLKVSQQVKACTDKLYGPDLVPSKTGNKTWNFCTEGVAHYGMLADFLQAIKTYPNFSYVNTNIMKNAEMFARMWEKAEKGSKTVK